MKILITAFGIAFSSALFSQTIVWSGSSDPSSQGTDAICWSNDGSTVFSGSECPQSHIRMWNSQNGQLLWDHLNDSSLECILGVKLASNGSVFGAIEENGILLIFDMSSTPQLIHQIDMQSGGARELDFSNDSQSIVATGSDDSLRIYNVSTGELVRSMGGHTAAVLSVDYSNDGTLIASGSADGTVRIWNATTGQSLAVYPFSTNDVNIVKFNQADTRVLVGLSNGDVVVIDLTAMQSSVLANAGEAVICADWSDTETHIAAGTTVGVKVFSFAGGSLSTSFNVTGGGIVNGVSFSHDGTNRICTGNGNGVIAVWDQALGLPSETEFTFGFWPNPASDVLHVQLHDQDATQYVLFAMDGRVMQRGNLNRLYNEIPVDGLPAGQYLLQISNQQRSKVVAVEKRQ